MFRGLGAWGGLWWRKIHIIDSGSEGRRVVYLLAGVAFISHIWKSGFSMGVSDFLATDFGMYHVVPPSFLAKVRLLENFRLHNLISLQQ